jgi:hypothetical protein
MNGIQPWPGLRINAAVISAIASAMVFVSMVVGFVTGAIVSRQDVLDLRNEVVALKMQSGDEKERLARIEVQMQYINQGIADLRGAKIIEQTPRR